MGFLSKLFNKNIQDSNIDVYKKYTDSILLLSKIPLTDANKLKASVYLCFAQLACIHVVSKGKAVVFMDAMVSDVKESVSDLKIQIGDLANDDDELQRILKNFPQAAQVDAFTTVNGHAAFQAIYSQFVEEIVTEISVNSNGPFGPHGFAALKLLEALRGKGKGKDEMLETSMKLTEMTGEVIKAFR